MVYIVGVIGFIGGFVLGLMILQRWLKDRSKEDLMENDGLKWAYGVFNWLIAALGAYCSIALYNIYFG